mmetsp:Transcript_1620/g.3501  ORF Transcript_1620/g.3501 Transcript_1620/m.3501 type:complete len:377 (-) Transcript_1620:1-1131(-)
MMRPDSGKRRGFASLYVNSSSDRIRAWLSKASADDFDSETSFDTKEKPSLFMSEGDLNRLNVHDLYKEIDNLKDKVDRAKQGKLREVRASAALKVELSEAEKKISELEHQNFWLNKELASRTSTVEKLEQHIARLEEQISERDTKHAEMVSTEAALTSIIKQHETELKDHVKKAEEDSASLLDTNAKLKELEKQVVFLRESFKFNMSAFTQADIPKSQRSDSTATEMKIGGSTFDYDCGAGKTTLKCDALEGDFSIDMEPIELVSKKGSFLDATDYKLPIRDLLQNESIRSCDSFDDFPTERSCEAELRAQIKDLEKKLEETNDHWRRENGVLQEYVDELKQLLNHFGGTKSGSFYDGSFAPPLRFADRVKHWFRS